MPDVPAQAVIVYFNGTFLQRSNGAHSRAEACLRFLLGQVERVVVYSFRNHPTCPWTDEMVERFGREFPRAELVLDERPRALVALTRLKNAAVALAPAWTKAVLALRLPGAAPRYAAMLRRHPDAVLIVNYVDGLTQLNGIAGRRVVVETHDIKFINYRMQARAAPTGLRTMLKFRSEIALLATAQGVIAISPTEAHVFRMLLDGDTVLYVPEFGRAARPAEVTGASEHFSYDLLFVGSENVLNVEGLVGFMARHASWLARYSVAVCGNVCGDPQVVRLANQHPNLRLLGFVDNMGEVYARSKAALSPVAGTGLKIKIVDALERGKPIFASPASLAGLPPGHEACVFPIERAAVLGILNDPARRRTAERAARDYFATFDQCGDRDRLLALLRSATLSSGAGERAAASPQDAVQSASG